MKINVINLEDKEYYFVKKKNINGNNYCYFTNVNDKKDLCIRKIILENGEPILIGLKDENELFDALKHFEDNELSK